YDVAHKVHTQDRALPQFTLHANVHLHSAWCLIVGRKESHAVDVGRKSKGIADIAEVVLWSGRSHRLLVLLLCRADFVRNLADRLAAKIRCEALAARQRYREVGATKAGYSGAEEQSFLKSSRTVKQDIVEDVVFIEQPDTGADRSFAVLPRVPGSP